MELRIDISVKDHAAHPTAKENREALVGVFREFAALPDQNQIFVLGLLSRVFQDADFLARYGVTVDATISR